MSDVGLTENVNDDKKFEIWFRKRSPDATFVLEAPSAEVKRLWISCISRLLWKQAIRNRQRRRDELSDMGHGWKPGMDLKRSNNYILDHAVCLTPHQNGLCSVFIRPVVIVFVTYCYSQHVGGR